MPRKIIVYKNKSLKTFSTFGVGGRAKYFTTARNAEEFLNVLKYAQKNKIPIRVFGGGSNVVFGDGTLNYFFIRFFGGRIKFDKNTVVADAGVLLADVVKRSVKRGLAGLEKLAGIPGTLGGAVYGNAGAFGTSIGDVVNRIEIWDGKKNFWVDKKFCNFKYRSSVFKKKPFYILRVELNLKKGNKNKILFTYKEIMDVRGKKYNNTLRCPGSFFKNVLVRDVSRASLKKINPLKIIDGKIPAGYLLEEVGVKGKSFGNLKVSDFHANLILNNGKATYEEVRKLSNFLKRKVKERFGILLEEEVVYIK